MLWLITLTSMPYIPPLPAPAVTPVCRGIQVDGSLRLRLRWTAPRITLLVAVGTAYPLPHCLYETARIVPPCLIPRCRATQPPTLTLLLFWWWTSPQRGDYLRCAARLAVPDLLRLACLALLPPCPYLCLPCCCSVIRSYFVVGSCCCVFVFAFPRLANRFVAARAATVAVPYRGASSGGGLNAHALPCCLPGPHACP